MAFSTSGSMGMGSGLYATDLIRGSFGGGGGPIRFRSDARRMGGGGGVGIGIGLDFSVLKHMCVAASATMHLSEQ